MEDTRKNRRIYARREMHLQKTGVAIVFIIIYNKGRNRYEKERCVIVVMYPYMTLADETEIVHSQIIDENGIQKVIVHFERPTEEGFDSARCELPSYKWIIKEGYSDDEITTFEQLLHSNAHLLYKYAASGGVQIA